MNFSPLEHLVVDALLRRVRVLACPQIEAIAETVGSQQLAKNAIRKLERHGLVESFKAEVVVFRSEFPLATWTPGDDMPNLGGIAWQAKSRFLNARSCQQSVTIATSRAEQLLGGVGGKLRQPN